MIFHPRSRDQDYFLNSLESYEEDKEKAKTKTGLHPLYGQIVSIGMYNPSTKKGMVFSLSLKSINLEDPDFTCSVFASEKDLLKGFWQTSQKYERFVTYNGNGFDFPFLAIRSAIQKVKIPFEINNRQEKFVDLMQKFRTFTQLSIRGIMSCFGNS
jgi:DNA polymerase elongation subunit (family B)